MDFVTDSKVARTMIQEIESLVKRRSELPDLVFHEIFTEFMALSFDDFFVDFCQRAHSVTQAFGESGWTFGVIEPDPEQFFYKQFSTYPFLEVKSSDECRDYESLLWKPFGDNPADSIDSIGTIMIAYPTSHKWVVYAHKEYEIGIVGCQDEDVMKIFKPAYGNDRVFAIKEAISEILGNLFKDHSVAKDFEKKLLINYD